MFRNNRVFDFALQNSYADTTETEKLKFRFICQVHKCNLTDLEILLYFEANFLNVI